MSAPGVMLDTVMSRRGASPVLVGRAAELATLDTALEAVRQGEPAAVLIGGEAGMGKTRLISEFAAAARAAGAQVLSGACLELGAEGLPFSPFTALLRGLVRETGPAEITRILAGSGRPAQDLARLLPELAAAASRRRAEERASILTARRGPGPALRGIPQPARAAGRGPAGGPGRRGRALGRPFQP